MAGGAQDGVQPQVGVRNDIACKDDLHIVAGVGKGVLSRPEETEDGVERPEAGDREYDADQDVQHQYVPQRLVGPLVFLLPQLDGYQGGGAYADQRAESRRQVHEREGERQSGYGHCAYAVADKDTVGYVVKGGGRHGDDGRYGVSFQQFADAFGS